MMTRRKIAVPEFLVAINYPRDRVKQTPLAALTLVDVMRDTLGTGPCQYILDLEGLNKTRSTGAAGTGKPTASATCSERGALVYYYLGERSESPGATIRSWSLTRHSARSRRSRTSSTRPTPGSRSTWPVRTRLSAWPRRPRTAIPGPATWPTRHPHRPGNARTVADDGRA